MSNYLYLHRKDHCTEKKPQTLLNTSVKNVTALPSKNGQMGSTSDTDLCQNIYNIIDIINAAVCSVTEQIPYCLQLCNFPS